MPPQGRSSGAATMTCLQPPSFFNHPMMWKRASVSSGQRLGRGTRFISQKPVRKTSPTSSPTWRRQMQRFLIPSCSNPSTLTRAQRDLLPAEHLVDAGYIDAGILVTSASVHHVEVIGPVRADTNWQARQGRGFAAECFEIDWEAKCVTCPQGKRSASWKERVDHLGHDVIDIADLLGRLQVLPSAQHLYTEEARFTYNEIAAPSAMPGAVRGSSAPTDAGISGTVCQASWH